MCSTGLLLLFEADGWEKYPRCLVCLSIIKYQWVISALRPQGAAMSTLWLGAPKWVRKCWQGNKSFCDGWDYRKKFSTHLLATFTKTGFTKPGALPQGLERSNWSPSFHRNGERFIQIPLYRSTRKTPHWETIYALIEVLSCFSGRWETLRGWFNLCRFLSV